MRLKIVKPGDPLATVDDAIDSVSLLRQAKALADMGKKH